MKPDTQPTGAPTRERVDVRKLPVWQQYALAVGIVLVVLGLVLLSWQSGRGPDPAWTDFLDRFFVPYAGFIGTAALVFVVARYVLRRRAR